MSNNTGSGEEASSSNANSFDKPSSPNSNHQYKNPGTFNNDNTDSVDSASGLRHRIFAGNLDFGTTKEQLYDAFSKCGKIVDEIRLHPGYAFIQFESEQACSKAIATLSGTQLCSKRIDVQMAKGPNNSQKKDNKRKLDSRDRQPPSRSNNNSGGDSKNDRFSRDRDNKNKKQKRTPPTNSQPPLSMPNSASMMPTSSPYSSTSSGVTSVPIYIPDQTLEPFANFVMQTLKSAGLIYHNVHIRNTNQGELFFTSPQFLQLVANERFVIYILARHEIGRNAVSFKALMPDGTSPGFADTAITDICSFILNAPPSVPVSNVYQQYAMQYSLPPTNTPPLNIPGMSFGYNPPQQPAQTYNRPPPSNQGGNYGNRDSRPSYNNNNNSRNNSNNSRNDRNNNNNNRNDRRDDDRRGNNNNNNNRTSNNNNYRGGSGTNSGSNSDNNEVQGLILKLLDTINQKPASSSNNSILLSESANSATSGNDDYHSPSNHHYQ